MSSPLYSDCIGDDENLQFSSTEVDFYLRLLLSNNSLFERARAVDYFRRLLIRQCIPPMPIADSLIKGLIQCLGVKYKRIQRDAAWALTNCACSPHHICYKIILHGGLEALIQCAMTTDGETQDQVFWTLGNIALDCTLCQAEVRRSSAIPVMIEILVSPTFILSQWKRNLVWAMAQIFRGGIDTLNNFLLHAALRGLCFLLYLSDTEVQINAAWAIAYMADHNLNGAQIDAVLDTPGLLNRLILLLKGARTMRAALRALGNIVVGNDIQTQEVLNAGLIPNLMDLFQMNAPINQLREIVWIMSNIAAGSQKQIDLLFQASEIVELFIDAFRCGDHRLNREIGWTVTNALTGASLKRSRWLCSSNLLCLLSEILSLQHEGALIERTLFAIETLVERRPIYMPVLQVYEVIRTVQKISQSNDFEQTVQERAKRILSKENDYRSHKIPSAIYILVR